METHEGQSSEANALQVVVQTEEKEDTGIPEGEDTHEHTCSSPKPVSVGKKQCIGSQSSLDYEEDIPETQPLLLEVLDKGFYRCRMRKSEEVGLPEDEICYLRGESNSSVSVPVQMGTMAGGKTEIDSEVARKYAEHCADVHNDPDTDLIKLTMEEFLCQSELNEDEFGPSEDLRSIFINSLNSSYSNEEQRKLWKLRHNRFVEVQRRKQQRDEANNDRKIVVSKEKSRKGECR